MHAELLVKFLVKPDALELAQSRAIIKGIPNTWPAGHILASIPSYCPKLRQLQQWILPKQGKLQNMEVKAEIFFI